MKTITTKQHRNNNLKTNTISSGKIVVGALAGLAVGAIAGILFAPDFFGF